MPRSLGEPMTSEAPQDVAALPQTEAAEPVTKAGDELLTDIINDHEGPSYHVIERIRRGVVAIEREAAAALLDQHDRLRSALERVVRHMEIMDRQADGDGYVVQVTVQTWLRTIRPEITAARDVLRGSGAEEAAPR